MLKTVQCFSNDIRGIHSGRASTSLLDSIVVNIYGRCQRLNQIASISVLNNKTLLIKVWDSVIVGEVKNAILNANINLSPIIENNNVIRVMLPNLTQEARKKLVKLLYQFAENTRIAIRNIRRDAIETIEKIQENKEISKDDLHSIKKKIQNITDDNIRKINKELSFKEKDILNC